MATRFEIAQIISMARAAYPNFQPDDRTPDAWLGLLGDIAGEALKAGMLACLSEAGRVFAPGVGEIRAAVYKLDAQAAGIPDAYSAYNEAVDAPSNGWVSAGEPWQAPDDPTCTWIIPRAEFKWSHPLVERVARLLGWPKRFPTDLPGADRAQFVKAYEAEVARVLNQANQLPALREYVEHKALELRGDASLKRLLQDDPPP